MKSSPIKMITNKDGFMLMEVLLSVVFLALIAAAAGGVYSAGNQSLDEQADRMLLDGKLRSRLELLIASDFSALADGSETVTVHGKDFTVTWTVVTVDLDGDSTPEPNVKKVTVSVTEISGRSLTTLLTNNEDLVRKL